MLAVFRGRGNEALPINQLPTELLALIFQHATPKGIDYYSELRDVRLVSRRWADIVWNCPSFWSIVVCDDEPKNVRLALARSKGLPLDVMVLCNDAVKTLADKDHHHPHFDEVVRHESSRWRSLTLDVYSATEMPLYLSPHCPNLRVLNLSVKSSGSAFGPTLFKGGMPNVEELVIVGVRSALEHLRVPEVTITCPHKTTGTAAPTGRRLTRGRCQRGARGSYRDQLCCGLRRARGDAGT